jgi:hypothetical protein
MLRDDGSDGGGRRRSLEMCSASRLISVRSNPWRDFIGMAAATPGERTLAVTRSVPLWLQRFSNSPNLAATIFRHQFPHPAFQAWTQVTVGASVPLAGRRHSGWPSTSCGAARLSRGCSRLLLACRPQTVRNRPCVTAVPVIRLRDRYTRT